MQSQLSSTHTQFDQYQLFILRVWQETPDGPRRYVLKATDDSRHRVFADAHSLADFLEQIDQAEQPRLSLEQERAGRQ